MLGAPSFGSTKPGALTRGHRFWLSCYNAAWLAALPLLKTNKRLSQGFRQRMAPPGWGVSERPGKQWQDVWIQAASGGESYLAWELLKHFPSLTGHEQAPLHVLNTTWTAQGLDILNKGAAWAEEHRSDLLVKNTYFPFDTRVFIRRALRETMPRVVVLLETELWPTLLAECAREEIPVVLVNGRMSRQTLPRYLFLRDFLRRAAPRRILAISDEDARRYALVFGRERVEVVNNIKFDRVAPSAAPVGENPLARLMPKQSPFLVLGSVREEEEGDVADALTGVFAGRPRTSVGLFPRHMHRIAEWKNLLEARSIPWALRSELEAPPQAGSVILWDVFGELGMAYALARAAYVGGALHPQGGQNFLEPLEHGLKPVIGRHWDNFAWVGDGIVQGGLVTEIAAPGDLAPALIAALKRPAAPESMRARFKAFLSSRQGGAQHACETILEYALPVE